MRAHAFVWLTVALGGCGAPPGSPGADLGGDDGAALTPRWAIFSPAVPQQMPRWGMPLVQVPAERRFVGFGGSLYPGGGAVAETWSLSMKDQSWSLVLDSTPPPAKRYSPCVAWLPDQNEMLLIGGRDDAGPLPPAAWTFNVTLRSWTGITGAELPPGVIGCHAAYLPSTGQAIVFGGGGSGGLSSETYAYDPLARTFTRLSPNTIPPARMDGATAYDPGDGGRMLMFGGALDVDPAHPQHLDDLWAFDGTDWTALAQGTHPAARRVAAAAFDGARRAWVIFGGTVETADLNDLWRYDAARGAWLQLSGDGAPPARGFASAGYDPIDDAYLVLGGLDQPSTLALADGWMLHLQ